MENKFDIDNHEYYNGVLHKLGLPVIDVELKKSKLWKLLGDDRFLKMEQEAFNGDSNMVYMRYVRQNGTAFTIKYRSLNLEKKYNLHEMIESDPRLINDDHDEMYDKYRIIIHYGIHFDSKGTIYHFCPDGVRYGQAEYDKELCSDEWKPCDVNKEKAFFTLMTIDEINIFCKKWNELIKYQLNDYNGKLFACVLAYWLN
jgi:hypothetical protein